MPNVQVKKVKAFPIAAKLTPVDSPEVVQGQILKLSAHGFLVEALVPAWKTGAKFQIQFELPVLHHMIDEACVVVKMYTSSETQVIEGHFQSISMEAEKHVMRFIASIPKSEGTP